MVTDLSCSRHSFSETRTVPGVQIVPRPGRRHAECRGGGSTAAGAGAALRSGRAAASARSGCGPRPARNRGPVASGGSAGPSLRESGRCSRARSGSSVTGAGRVVDVGAADVGAARHIHRRIVAPVVDVNVKSARWLESGKTDSAKVTSKRPETSSEGRGSCVSRCPSPPSVPTPTQSLCRSGERRPRRSV